MNAKNYDNLTPLHIAVKRGNLEAAETLVKLDHNDGVMERADVNLQGGREQWSPLHIAAYGSYYRIVTLLINNGADIFLRNKQGKSALTSITNNLLMIKILKKSEIFHCVMLLSNSNHVTEANLINVDLI